MRVFLFSNIAPHYRAATWKTLLASPELDIHFFFGRDPSSEIKEIDLDREPFASDSNRFHRLRNRFFRNYIAWQHGVFGRCLAGRFEIAIFFGEMTCLSTWLAALACRARGKKVVFWGHGIYGREEPWKMRGRVAFLKLAHRHLLYGPHGKRQMVSRGFPPENIYIIFNSLDHDAQKKLREPYARLKKEEVFPFFNNPSLPAVIFIGRLTAMKKVEILVEALLEINRAETRVNALIIGDGPRRQNLSTLGAAGIASGWLHFSGAIYDEEETGRALAAADLAVSPGNAGLNVMHSLSFGTPVATHGNMVNQGPEAEAIREGETGFFFREGDPADLAEKIMAWFSAPGNRQALRTLCYEVVDRYYNPRYQLSVFLDLVNNRPPKP